MNSELIQNTPNIPKSPGIYQFKDKNKKVIYIGKAKNLRSRIKQYFSSQLHPPRIQKMITLIDYVEIIKTDSEVESLILEMNLIKELKPRYNVNLKDDKSYPYIRITREPFPRIFSTRNRRNDGSKYFGPFTNASSMKYYLKIIRDIFKVRNCSYNITGSVIKQKEIKLCLEYQIKKCEGPCEGLVSEQHYNSMISEAEKLLNGKTSSLINELQDKMNDAAKKEKFEDAADIRNKISALEEYSSKQKIISNDMLDKDIFGVVSEENDACAMILNVREGKVIGKRHFYIDSVTDKTDEEVLERVLYRYYSEKNFIPNQIHLQCELKDINIFKKWLGSLDKKKVEFIFPKRGKNAQLLSMVKTNAKYMLDELKLQRLKKQFIPNSVASLKNDLHLNKLPLRIECFDISNLQGTDTVASMIVFYNGQAKKGDYRKFKIRSATYETGKPDDFASMREVIYRRYSKYLDKKENNSSARTGFENMPFPDLIMVDGGKGQLSSAVKVLDKLGFKDYNIIGLAKRLEEVFLPGHLEAQTIAKTSASLKLLQRIRNEAHRFAITYHRNLRSKRILISELESLKGIGKRRAAKLLTDYESAEKAIEVIKQNSSS